MLLFQRRQLLREAMRMSLLAGLKPLFGDGYLSASMAPDPPLSGEIRLNILLHGMFAIIIANRSNNGQEVTVLPPHVVGSTPHVYLATDMKGSPPTIQWFKRGSDYSFSPKGETVRPEIDNNIHAVIPFGGDIQRNEAVKPHCTIKLPWPRRIIPLRSVNPFDRSKKLFTNSTGLLAQPSQVPLITMLQYVEGATGIGSDINTNYHIFAEPVECPPDFHSADAFKTLKSLFTNLDKLEFNTTLTPKLLADINDPAGTGVTIEEEKALVELDMLNCTGMGAQGGGGRLGVHPTSCMSLLAVQV